MASTATAQADFRIFDPGTRPMLPLETGFDRFEAICLGPGPGFPTAVKWLVSNGALPLDRSPNPAFRYELPDEELNALLIFQLRGGSNECAVTFGTDQARAAFFAELTRRYGPRRTDGFFAHPASGKLVHTQASSTFNGQEHHRLVAIWPEDGSAAPGMNDAGDGNGTPGSSDTLSPVTEPLS